LISFFLSSFDHETFEEVAIVDYALMGVTLEFKMNQKGRFTILLALMLTRVNLTNVLDEGLRIGGIGRQMNSKVRLVKISIYRK
jgi:hypothetical protein